MALQDIIMEFLLIYLNKLDVKVILIFAQFSR